MLPELEPRFQDGTKNHTMIRSGLSLFIPFREHSERILSNELSRHANTVSVSWLWLDDVLREQKLPGGTRVVEFCIASALRFLLVVAPSFQ